MLGQCVGGALRRGIFRKGPTKMRLARSALAPKRVYRDTAAPQQVPHFHSSTLQPVDMPSLSGLHVCTLTHRPPPTPPPLSSLSFPFPPHTHPGGGAPPAPAQVFYLNAPIVGTWKPGEQRTYYFWAGFSRASSNRITCIPFRAGNAGVVCVKAANQNGQEAGRVALTLQNSAGADLPASQTSHRFGIQVGP